MNVVKTISTTVKNAVRFVKFLRMGKSDVQECRQIAPYGVDSNPIKNMVALYSKTGEDGKNVIIGYVNKDQIADVGENRIFSTDENGNLSFYLHLKNDGTADFGGDSRTMVRYQELESAFNQLKSDFNAHVSAYNSHIHPFVGVAAGVTSSTTPTTSLANPSSADISGAEIQEIKTL